MDYLITNFEYDDSKRFGDIYYSGSCIRIDNNILKVRESADWRCFGKYAEKIKDSPSDVPVDTDDFYFCLDYDIEKHQLIYQTDIIGFETPFYYYADGLFAISDNFIDLLLCLNKAKGFNLEIDEKKAIEYLLYTESFFEDTCISDVYRGDAASICCIDMRSLERKNHVYNIFKMTGETSSVEEAADSLYNALHDYFVSHKGNGEAHFTIGMSGGLDSRVGAYFAKKCGYSVNPIFIGKKKNYLGILTNDCKRAEEVNTHLGFQAIKYYDPRKKSFDEKVAFEAKHAPTVVDNIAQNMGSIDVGDCIINGIIGGEALGALITKGMPQMSTRELAELMVNTISNIPKFKSRAYRRLAQFLPFSSVKRIARFKEEWINDILSEEDRERIICRIENWIKEQKKSGLDNINIYHKYFYYRFAAASKFSYYATMNNTKPSLCTYLNPIYIKEMLTWKSEYLIDKKIQKKLICKMDGLSSIRSQTIESDIDGINSDNPVKKLGRIVERVIRGGGMVYTQWYSPRMIKRELQFRRNESKVLSDLVIRNAWFKSDYHFAFGFMKLIEIDRLLKDNDKIV